LPPKISFLIDWLSVNADSTDITRIGPSVAADAWQPCKAFNFYDTGFEDYATGCKRLESSKRADMGVLYVASGKVVQNICTAVGTDNHVEALCAYGLDAGRATRIDLCFDVWDDGELARKIARSSRECTLKCVARSQNVREETNGGLGLTTYLGVRTGSRYGRVYNKSAESDLKVPVSRFELECKNKFAAVLWGDLKRSVLNNALAQVVKGVWNGYVPDWGVPDMMGLFDDCEIIEPPSRESRDSDTKEWLTRQVMPCLVKSVKQSPVGQDLMTWLVSEVKTRLEQW